MNYEYYRAIAAPLIAAIHHVAEAWNKEESAKGKAAIEKYADTLEKLYDEFKAEFAPTNEKGLPVDFEALAKERPDLVIKDGDQNGN